MKISLYPILIALILCGLLVPACSDSDTNSPVGDRDGIENGELEDGDLDADSDSNPDSDGDLTDGDTADGDVDSIDGDLTDGDTNDGDVDLIDGDGIDGDGTDGDTTDGDVTDGDIVDGDATDGDVIPDGDLDSDEDPGLPDIEITNLTAIENPSNVLSYYVEWETSRLSKTYLDADCGIFYHEEFEDNNPRSQHRVFVMGLTAQANCTFTATAVDPAGRPVSRSISRSVGELPDFLPHMSITKINANKIQTGWTLFNLSNGYDNEPMIVAMIDVWGQYRWYYRVQTTYAGNDNDIRTIPEGVLIAGNHGMIMPQKIDWEGNRLWSIRLNMHHHMEPWGDGQLLYLDDNLTCSGGAWEGHEDKSAGAANIWDIAQGKVVWTWVICHHYVPDVIRSDWSHLNSVDKFPSENAMLVSSREQNALFKVNLQTEDIVWKLGLSGDFDMGTGSQFYAQHDPEIQSNGNILMFDNGREGYRTYSRGLEISYNDISGQQSVQKVWSFEPDPAIFAPIWGDADRMDNGNVLLVFGQRSTVNPSHLIEVTHESDPEEVWHVQLPVRWGVYRSERVVEPIKGYVITD